MDPLPDPLYTHRCSLPDRTLWFGRASLYETHIHIQGWTWQGRYEREVAVEDIDEIDWRPRPKGSNVALHLDTGEAVAFRLHTGAGLWNAKLHDLLGESLLDGHRLPGNGRAETPEGKEAS